MEELEKIAGDSPKDEKNNNDSRNYFSKPIFKIVSNLSRRAARIFRYCINYMNSLEE